jgi:hypothetical protein
MSVVIQPAGSSASREHYLDTVESLVNISQYQELIGNTFLDLFDHLVRCNIFFIVLVSAQGIYLFEISLESLFKILKIDNFDHFFYPADCPSDLVYTFN